MDGRDVDDAAAASLLDHPATRALRTEEGAVEIDRERVSPVVEGELEQIILICTPRTDSGRRGLRLAARSQSGP